MLFIPPSMPFMEPVPEAEATHTENHSATAPDAITGLDMTSIGKWNNRSDRNYIKLSWNPPNDNGSPITQYVVQIHEISGNDWTTLDNNVQVDNNTGYFYTHENAAVGYQFSYRVWAISDGCVGEGNLQEMPGCNESNIAHVVSLPNGAYGAPISQCNNSDLDDCGYFADTTPPVITTTNITNIITNSTGLHYSYDLPPAFDTITNSTGTYYQPYEPTCSPAPGAFFSVGIFTVTCTATDEAGNTGTASFTITIEYLQTDTTPPVIIVPSAQTYVTNNGTEIAMGGITYYYNIGGINPCQNWKISAGIDCGLEGGGGYESPSFSSVTVTDNSGDLVVVTNFSGVPGYLLCDPLPGAFFSAGTTTVTCTATDAAGNVGTASFTVTVVLDAGDTTPPIVTVPDDMIFSVPSNWPDDNAYIANGTEPTATDDVGVTSFVCFPVSTTSWDGEGTSNGLAQNILPTSLSLFGQPHSTFRIGITTVTCTATDAAGNEGIGTFTITVVADGAEETILEELITEDEARAAAADNYWTLEYTGDNMPLNIHVYTNDMLRFTGGDTNKLTYPDCHLPSSIFRTGCEQIGNGGTCTIDFSNWSLGQHEYNTNGGSIGDGNTSTGAGKFTVFAADGS